MTPTLLLLSSLAALSGAWQTYTSTNYVNGVAGTDSILYLATFGGLQLFRVQDTSFQEVFTNAEGWPVNRLSCCVRDRAGYIWVGTEGGGLVIFDPVRQAMSVYRKDDLPLKINCLNLSGDTILAGTDNGAFIIDTRGTTSDQTDDAVTQFQWPRLQSNTVLSLGVTAEDFWTGSNQGVDRITRMLDTVVSFRRPQVPGDSVKATLQKGDTIYAVTEWGLGRYNGQGFDPVAQFPSGTQNVRGMVVYRSQLFVASKAGLWVYDQSGFTNVWAGDWRAILGLSNLWLGGGGDPDVGNGIARRTSGGAGQAFASQGLYSSHIEAALIDTSGGIYACHFSGPKRISHLTPEGSWEWLTDTLLNAVLLARDSRNRVWFGHWAYPRGGGVSVYDPDSANWRAYSWGSMTTAM